MEKTVSRFHMIDTLRGVMIVGVVLAHFVFDMEMMGFAWAHTFMQNPIFNAVAVFGRIMFVFIAGICSRLSRNNIKRSLLVLGGAAVVSLVTLVLDLIMFGEVGHLFIYFGILHLLGFCMLFYGLLELALRRVKINEKSIFIISGALFVLFAVMYFASDSIYSPHDGYFGLFGIKLIDTAGNPLHGSIPGILLGFGGFKPLSADYFPILPWSFMFFSGAFLGKFFKEDKVPALLHRDICPPVTYIGRKTLWIYMLHQPLVYGLAVVLAELYS